MRPPVNHELLAEIGESLLPHEQSWKEKSEWFQSKGYLFRPRFREGWEPSWRTNGRSPQFCEDFTTLPLSPNLIDATRKSDGKLVYIKRVKTGSSEVQIASKFSKEPLSNDPSNHCVPILETLTDNIDSDISYLVMPYLRLTDDPPFDIVNDIVDLADQLFEGLAFMHSHNIAHRDCAYKNLMMDATSMYPKGFHPVETDKKPNMRGEAPHHSRFTTPRSVKYYYVDFGISSQFTSDDEEQTSRLVVGTDGLDDEVPELSDVTPYDPFKVDVFILGNYFKRTILRYYDNVSFLSPLVDIMTAKEPAARPDAATIIDQWKPVKRNISRWERLQPLKLRTEFEEAASCTLWPLLRIGPMLFLKGLFCTSTWLRDLGTRVSSLTPKPSRSDFWVHLKKSPSRSKSLPQKNPDPHTPSRMLSNSPPPTSCSPSS